MIAVDFDAPPAVGTRLLLDDQTYELAAIEDYQRRDGVHTNVLRWRTDCPVCGTAFEATTGLRCAGIARRCEAHRSSKRPVKGRKGRKVAISVIPA